MKHAYLLIRLTFLFLFIGAITQKLEAQTSPSGQVKFITPTVLSACNTDTICVTLTNLQGAKGVTYAGNVSMEIDIPGGALVEYINSSVKSVPTGASQTSYAANKLTIGVPLPALGATTKICFVVRPDCNVANIGILPKFKAKVTYPASYPTPTETFNSAAMNIGKTVISHTLVNQTSNGNPTTFYSGGYILATNLLNSGYGIQNELIYTTINHKDMVYGSAEIYNTGGINAIGTPVAVTPLTTVTIGDYVYRTYQLTGTKLGPDFQFTPGETTQLRESLTNPAKCGSYKAKRFVNYTCGVGTPTCIKADTLYSNINVIAGSPKLDGTLISAEDPNGCPNKLVKFSYKNNGTGVNGTAFDVNLGVGFGGGLMTINNVKVNGIAIPASQISPTASGTSFTIKLKDWNTNPALGLEDADADGFYDDIKVGTTVPVEFTYTIPCKEACGANLYYAMASNATFTDFCRVLVGSTGTGLKNFGFQQVQPIVQLKAINYGTLTAGQSVADTAKFTFKYTAFNINYANTTAEFRIRYSRKMEIDLASIRINGVAPTNAPVIYGNNSTGAAPDNDSMVVVTLTAAEILALTDATADALSYKQTVYACTDRQVSTTTDYWQLIVKMQSGLCPDGSQPCEFDLACKKTFAHSSTLNCAGVTIKPCLYSLVNFKRLKPIGFTNVGLTTAIPNIDSTRTYAGDTVQVTNRIYPNGNWNTEPNGFWTAQGKPDQDLTTNMDITYSTPKDWLGKTSAWVFLPGYSQVVIRQRTPNFSNLNLPGTIGPVLFSAPLLLEDFKTNVNTSATSQTDYGITLNPSIGESPSSLCLRNHYSVQGLCPAEDGNYYPGPTNISRTRYRNLDHTKIKEFYGIFVGKALARAGWTGSTTTTDFYVEVQTKWRMDENFPWDNTGDLTLGTGYGQHTGNLVSSNYGSTNIGACNVIDYAKGLTVSKVQYIANPNSVYQPSCNLHVNHAVFFKTFEGDYFRNGEVRVPFKIDSVVVDLPTEYALSNVSLKYNQSCADATSTAITASATTGHVVFKNGTTDFPRIDDCSGNKIAYNLEYDLTKTGTAAPAIYRFPIKIYARDEFNKVFLMTDSAAIQELKPDLTVTPISPTVSNTDGGNCQPVFFDFMIQNKTAYDAPNTYFAAESSSGTTVLNITDAGNVYTDPIVAADTSKYATNNVFAKLGTIKSGEIRIVRVFTKALVCADNFKIYVDFGCNYPSPLKPNLASTSLDQASAAYQATTPAMLILPIGGAVNVIDLCGTKDVEIEVRNASLANLYKMKAGIKLPASVDFVAGSAQLKHTTATGTYVAVADVTTPGTADSVVINFAALAPFNTTCALTGSDTTTRNDIRIKFKIKYKACPTNGTEELFFTIRSENYCGTEGKSYGVVPINYVGSAGKQNNYSLSTPSANAALKLCASKNQTQNVSENLYIKNLGGYGAASGISSGKDSATITVAIDPALLSVTNWTFAAPFNAPVVGSDINGNVTYRVLIPAGIAIGDSLAVPVTYTLTPKVDKLCLENTKTVFCIFSLFTSPIILECTATGLTCGTISKSIRGTGLKIRKFQCNYGSIGDYVWADTNKDGQQAAVVTEPVIVGAKVYLYEETTPGTYVKIDSTTSNASGKYLFSNLFSGNYKVQFVAPTNYNLTNLNTGVATTDSDAGVNGYSGIINIDTCKPVGDIGRDNPTIDAGFVPCGITANLTSTNPKCNGGTDGTVTLTVIGNFLTPTYLWSNGATSKDLTSVGAGTYKVTITDGFCKSTTMITVTEPSLLTINCAKINVSYNGASDGSASVAASGGTSPYTYLWNTGATTVSITNKIMGTYTVTVTDANGCTKTCSSVIGEPNCNLSLTISGVNEKCKGDAIGSAKVIAANNIGAITYLWSNGNATNEITNLAAGTYTVTVTESATCSASMSYVVTEPTVLAINCTKTNVTYNGASDGSASVSASGGTSPYSYLWSNGATTASITNKIMGTYSVTVTDANGCTKTCSSVIGEPNCNLSLTISGVNEKCKGDAIGSAKVVASNNIGAITYLWSNGNTTNQISNLTAGVYAVTVTESATCSATIGYTVTEPTLLTINCAKINVSYNGASDGSASVSASGGTSPYTYLWNTGATTVSITNKIMGTYSVTVTDANGCTKTCSSVIGEPNCNLSLTISGVNEKCKGDAIGSAKVVASNNIGAITYLWSNGNTTNEITNLSVGSYTVTVTESATCTASISYTVTEPSLLSINCAKINVSYNGASDGLASVSASGGTAPYKYIWNTNDSTSTIINKKSGVYSVMVTDANGCKINCSSIISEPVCNLTATTSGTPALCNGASNGEALVVANGNINTVTYLWSNAITTANNPNLSAGTYSVTVTESNTCSVVALYIVNQPNVLNANCSKINVTYSGGSNGSVTVGGSGGTAPYRYLWSTGALTSSINNIKIGIYTVTITDKNNCKATCSTSINEPGCNLAIAISGNDLLCNGASNGDAIVTVSGNINIVTYLWNTTDTTENIENLKAGKYFVTVSESPTCVVVAEITIKEPTVLTLICSKTDATYNGGLNGSATVAPSGGVGPYTYIWNNGETTQSIQNLAKGIYEVTVTDKHGCSKTCSSVVSEPNCDLKVQLSGVDEKCFGNNFAFINTIVTQNNAPVEYKWSSGETSDNLQNLYVGTYTLTVTESATCKVKASFTIKEPSMVTINCSATDATYHGAKDGSAQVVASGGTAPYSYSWSNGEITDLITGLVADTFIVHVTDNQNCDAVCSSIVAEPVCKLAVNIKGKSALCFGSNTGSAKAFATGNIFPVTYLWSNNVVTSSNQNLIAGVYKITVTESKTCSAIATYIVSEPTLLSLTCSKTNITYNGALDGVASVVASGGQQPYKYKWNNGDTTATITGLKTGIYDVTVTDLNNCTEVCSSAINEPSCNLSIATTGTNVKCFGNATGTVSVTATGFINALTFVWNTGDKTVSINNLSAGTYIVTVTESPTCAVISSYKVLTANPLNINCTKTDVTFNGGNNGAATTNASGGTSPYTYNWNTGDTTSSIQNLKIGTYTVTVTDVNGCSKTCSSIVSEPSCGLKLTLSGVNEKCNGNAKAYILATVSGNNSAVTYLWSNNLTINKIENIVAGTYSVTVSESATCSLTDVYIVSEPQPLVAICSSTNATYVAALDGKASVAVSGGTLPYKLLWSNNDSIASLKNLAIGNISVTVTDANGCVTDCSKTISSIKCNLINPQLSVVIDEKSNTILADNEYVIYANPIGVGFSPNYFVKGSLLNKNFHYGEKLEIGRLSTNLTLGHIIINDAADSTCSFKDASYNLKGSTCILLANPNIICNDAGTPNIATDDTYSLTLKPTGNISSGSYNVSGGFIANNLSYNSPQQIATGILLNSGQKILNLQDVQNPDCQLLNILIDPQSACKLLICNINTNTSIIKHPSCSNNDGEIDLKVVGNVGKPNFKWSNGAITEDLNGLAIGEYFVTITDGDCILKDTFTLIKSNTTTTLEICNNLPVLLEIQDTTLTNIKWQRNGIEIPGETGVTLSTNQIGIYTYTSNGIGGCAVGQCCAYELIQGVNCCPLVPICLKVTLTRN